VACGGEGMTFAANENGEICASGGIFDLLPF
jgi:hypothetical protein